MQQCSLSEIGWTNLLNISTGSEIPSLQFWQDMQYIKLEDLQVTDVLMSTVGLFDVAFTLLQIWTKGYLGYVS